MTKSGVEKVVKQIEKQVEVIKAFYHTDSETIFQESALYKMKSSSLFEERHIQNVIKDSNARIVTVNPEFFVIEKTGFRDDTEKLYKDWRSEYSGTEWRHRIVKMKFSVSDYEKSMVRENCNAPKARLENVLKDVPQLCRILYG